MSRSLNVRKGLLSLGVALPLMDGAALAQTRLPRLRPPLRPRPPPSRCRSGQGDRPGQRRRHHGRAISRSRPRTRPCRCRTCPTRRSATCCRLSDRPEARRQGGRGRQGRQRTEFARKLAYNRDKALLDEYLDQEAKKAVTPEAARKLYDETVKSVPAEQEVRARHILVESEDDAKKAAARVKGGEDFAKVAGELSKDPGSKTDGGDLGFFTKDRMVEPFAEAAFKLEPGQISDPVKSQFGWHVIKVEEKRTKPVPSFEETKDQVETYLARKAQQDLIMGLRKNAKIERLDDKGNLVEQKKQ